MQVSETAIYDGPSIYAQRPVVRHILGGADQPTPGRFDPALLEALYGQLPGLRESLASCGSQKLMETDSVAGEPGPGHLFEHVCIELQKLAGADLACVRIDEWRRIGPFEAIVPCEDADVEVEAARLAGDWIRSLLPRARPSKARRRRTFDFEARLADFLALARRTMLPVQDRELIRSAGVLDVPVIRLAGRIIQLGQGRFQQRLSATKTTLTNVVSNDLAANKDYARRVLGDLGLPIPRYERAYRLRDAVKAAERIGYPVVVKPNNGSMGGGVSVGMKDADEVRAAYKRARALGRSVLVEEVIEGADYRMLVINGELCAAANRVPAHVVGDGTSTIEELVEKVNSDPRRGGGQSSAWTRIEFDEQADRLMAGLDYTRQSVPAADEAVYLRRNANTSDGGTAVDVTDEVHPDNRDIAVRAARAIGLDVAGVDLLTRDISRSMWKQPGCICEVNSRPGLRKHMWPAVGKRRDVTTPIVDMLFPRDRRSRLPVIAVTGTGSTGTAARMLAHILEKSGHQVGLAVGGRGYLRGRRSGPRRLTAPAAARMIFLDPDVDVAVLELTPDDVLRNGLGCDAINVAAIVNTPAGDGDGGEAPDAVIDAICVVARTARDVVLLADDDRYPAAQLQAGGAELCRVATKGEGRREADRIASTGRRVVSEGKAIFVYDQSHSEVRIPVVQPPEIPDLDPVQVARCALFASASAYFVGEDPREIHRSLSSFSAPAPRRSGKARRKSRTQP